MTTLKPKTLEFLLQLDVIRELIPKIGKEQWQTLYCTADESPHRFGMWCALLDGDAADRAIGHDSWDLMIGDEKPGIRKSRPDSMVAGEIRRQQQCPTPTETALRFYSTMGKTYRA